MRRVLGGPPPESGLFGGAVSRLLVLLLTVGGMGLLAACSGNGSDQGSASEGSDTQTTESEDPGEQTGQGESVAETGEESSPEDGPVIGTTTIEGFAPPDQNEVRDGVWAIGDAGEVEFQQENGGLTLLETRPESDWQVRTEEESDEIDAYFTQGNQEWHFEAEVDDGRLEIDLELDIDDAQPGLYEVGDAGSVEFDYYGSTLSLVDVQTNEGWQSSIEEEDSDEIEVDFARDNVEWDFEVEIDDGRLELEIDQEVR